METCADRFVHYLAEQLTPSAMSTEEIQDHSADDPELTQVRQCIINNQKYKLPPQYKQVAQELCIVNNIVLRNKRIVLPSKLRNKAILLAHEDHAGMTKCKQRIRSKLWWPNMDKDIEHHIRSCHPCQIVGKPDKPEPVQPTKLLEERWSQLAIDLCGPFPTGEHVAVLTDYYSRWPEVKILRTVTSTTILQWLDTVFATHGYPKEIKSDNATYFTSHEFKETLASWGIQLRTVTPYWPQANGQVERFNQVLLKHILTSNATGKDWRNTLPNMLRHYRTTPHQSTGETPAMMLMQRDLRTKLPSISPDKPLDDTKARKSDAKAKSQAKEYADSKRKAKIKEFKAGDLVLLQQRHHNKYSTAFHPDPLKIIQINGTQLVIEDKTGKTHRRNSAHVKKFVQTNQHRFGKREEEEIDITSEKSTPEKLPQQSQTNIHQLPTPPSLETERPPAQR